MNDARPIRRLAIANRGEAAMRCIRAVKALREEEGSELQAIALYTESDRDALFVRHADRAVELPAPRGELAAWLDHDALLETLHRTGADAVWPGWGFVAEDAAFVERLEREGIRFLGPASKALRALGDKIEAKRLAEEAGVAVVPWSGSALADASEAERAARELGFPVALKAANGGGGRGIRIVAAPGALAEAFRSASAEARAAFGDGRLLLERVIAGGRHVEVQIAADRLGAIRSLGCRDCSVQRRHQKLIEEAPPPGLAPGVRRELEQAAVRVAAAAGYSGVGTVEFLVTPAAAWFLEVNPRLQVEHGVTEELCGLDLVRLQIQIARGESLASLAVEERGHAIEARVCAEDPDAGFRPSPGRIARFDAALGPRVRVDTGEAAGSRVVPAFDSLIAKVIASGASREEARARLAAALADTDLVIEGGATNKGWLVEILDHPDFRAGGVDTTWLDRFAAAREPRRDHACAALMAAGILSYQRARALFRLNFYADTTHSTSRGVPPSEGMEVDLVHGGEQYRLRVYAIGAWRYLVQLDGRAVTATLREQGAHTARLQIGERTLRLLYDVSDARLRVEVEGHAYGFESQQAGQVRASMPAMVVAIHVAPGERVEAGQRLGLLEAMKTEVGFEAPVPGVVQEVLARAGQQVAAGDLLLRIDPSPQEPGGRTRRLELEELPDPLAPLFAGAGGERLARPDLAAADRLAPEVRRPALEAVREEVRRVLLGYDAAPERAERLAEFLEAELPPGLSASFCWELAELRHELIALADVARLFIRWPAASVSGELGPSNHARLRMYLRRLGGGGAGISEAFLELLRGALAHYGVPGLEPSDALARAVLRLFGSQLRPELRDRLAVAMLQRITALVRAGVDLGGDQRLAAALEQIAALRGLVSNAVADAAIEARYLIFEGPEIERQAERTTKQVQIWLDAAETRPHTPPDSILCQVADAPRGVFERVGRWLADPEPRRRAIALAAHVRRLYSPLQPVAHEVLREAGLRIERLELEGSRCVLAAASAPAELRDAAERLVRAARRGLGSRMPLEAVELFVPVDDDAAAESAAGRVARVMADGVSAARFSLSLVRPGGPDSHRTFQPTPEGWRECEGLHGVHPEAARRIDLQRLARFELERLPGVDGIYCFHARSPEVAGDERIFVLADLRSRSPDDGREADLHLAAFEHSFHEATRWLRSILAARDPKRRLQWNRIGIYVAPEIFLDPGVATRLSRRLAPDTRHLGLEKVVVRLRLLDREAPGRPGRETEIVISDVTGSNMTIDWREPKSEPLSPRSEYERKVVDARRRRLVYPYEIVRMLTGAGRANGGEAAVELPRAHFEEFDLDPSAAAPRAKSVAGRPYGENQAAVVFGVISTPTEKVPEGMRRVLVLSDPTRGMGALAAPECERVAAALELAAELGVPLEWVAVSSGARIAMDSGTENLDATARVVRRIVEFTQAGGSIHVIVPGVNVGAQSYFDALSTMLMHTRGALIMTAGGSMVLTGRAALDASGGVSAEDELAIGGLERVMGPNGEAQYYAKDLADAYRILHEHYRYSYVVPGEPGPRRQPSADPPERGLDGHPCEGGEFESVAQIFDAAANPGRKRPFPMRAVMSALVDSDGGHLERWRAWVGAETAIVWDAHLGGWPVTLIGIESQSVSREGYRPGDGPAAWSGGTLFPNSSKKLARALNAASGNRPAVILANLTGFDGSPESMRKLQLEYGAEIARAVVNFRGPILFLVVSRYHGGAYVVFSRALNPRLRAAALEGSFASVIGGGPAAAVVFGREVRARAAADARVQRLRETRDRDDAARARYERVFAEVLLEKQAELAEAFDQVHTVGRAKEVGSLEAIVAPAHMRAYLIERLEEEAGR